MFSVLPLFRGADAQGRRPVAGLPRMPMR